MKKHKDIFLLLIISLIPLVTLFHLGLPITHDGQDHVARIANFYNSLSEGILIPRWAGNLNWGYGHPILMFLYPLPSYMASIFHFVGLTFVDSVKAVFGLSFVLSALFMYLWIRNFLGSIPALTGAIIYSFAPYRFVDLYVRGAIGEHVAFMFLPLICYFLLKLNKDNKFAYIYFLGLIFSSAGLILSHNAISLMFFPFVGFYAIYLYFRNKNNTLFISSLFGVMYGFLISAFFWIPALIEGKYTLRDIVTKNEALNRFVDIQDLFYGQWSFGGTGLLTTQVGIVSWIFILLLPLSLYLLYKKRKTEAKSIIFLLFIFAFFIASIFIMLDISRPVWEFVTILQKFQFPWRFLTISVFMSSVIGAFVVYSIPNQRIRKHILFLVIIFSLLLTKDYWKANGFYLNPESFYTGIYNSTTDTGESSPRWSVRFMEKRPDKTIEVIEGKAKISEISRKSNYHKFEIISEGKSRIKENTLYFPGWKIFIDGVENKEIEFQDPNHRGIMTFYVDSGKHNIEAVFTDTKLRSVSNLITGLSFGFLVLLSLGIRKKWLKI